MYKPQGEYQHETVITPPGWTDEDRQRFFIRLRRVIDDLYRRTGTTAYRLEKREKQVNGEHGEI